MTQERSGGGSKPSDGPEFRVPDGERAYEALIKAKGADRAPRVTADGIAAKISDVLYSEFAGGLTICIITLRNGFSFVDMSAPASPENYDKEIGRKIAYDRAFKQIWSHEGYLLKELLFMHARMEAEQDKLAAAVSEADDPTDTQAALGQKARE